jgi:hypothetical protein
MVLRAAKGTRGELAGLQATMAPFRRLRPALAPVDCADARGGAFAVLPAFCPTGPY